MYKRKLKQFIHRNILLWPVFLYVIIQCYRGLRPWCEHLHDEYPLKVDLKPIRVGAISLRGFSPINENKYGFIHNPQKMCQDEEIGILSLVKSKSVNMRQREVIRNTWGQHASSGANRLVFSLGTIRSSELQKQIDAESDTYHDILQGQFEDTYLNLTLKSMNGIYWITKYCSSARFITMIDEDVIINFPNMEKFFSEIQMDRLNDLFTGYVTETPAPNRFDTKFAISLADYPYPCFPPYVSGPIVLTTGRVIKMFNVAIPYVKRFIFEDVYLGIVAMKLGMTLSTINNDMFDYDGSRIQELPCIISSHQGGDIPSDRYEELYLKNTRSSCQR